MSKKLFTFLLALTSSVGMSWAVEETYTWNETICHDINCSPAGNTNNRHYDLIAEWDNYDPGVAVGFTNNTMTFKRNKASILFKSNIGAITNIVITGSGIDSENYGYLGDYWSVNPEHTVLTFSLPASTSKEIRFMPRLSDTDRDAEATVMLSFTVTSIQFTVQNDCQMALDFPRCQLITNGWNGPRPGSSCNFTLQTETNPFGATGAGWRLRSVGHYQPNATPEQINTMYEGYDEPQIAYTKITEIINGLLHAFTGTTTASPNWAEYSAKIEVFELLKYNSSTSTYEHAKVWNGSGASFNETGYGIIYSYWKSPEVICDLYTAGNADAPYVFFKEAWVDAEMEVTHDRVYYLHNSREQGVDKDVPTFWRGGGTIGGWAKITALQEFDPEVTLQEVTYTSPTSKEEVAYTGGMVELINAGSINGGTWEYSLDGIHWGAENWNYMATPCGDYTIYCRIVPDEYHKYTGENPVVVLQASIVPPFVIDNEDPYSVLYNMYWSGTPSDLLVKRTIYADGYYNTLCLPFNITAAELAESTHPLYGYETLKTMRGAQVSGSGQNLTIDIFVEDATEIVAGQPYLISYPADRVGGDIVNPYFAGITVLMANNPGSISAGGVTFQGMFAPTHIVSYDHHDEAWPRDDDHDYLFLGEKNELTWPLYDQTYMRGFRAYFIIDRAQITSAMAPAHTRARLVDASKMPTGVESIQSSAIGSQKIIENGVLYIMKNGVRYNAQGQIVK